MKKLEKPKLHNLNEDIGEAEDIADQHEDIVEALSLLAEGHRKTIVPVVSQLDIL